MNSGIVHEPGYADPWMIAMDCPLARAAALDYSVRWRIEPMFSDFKSRGFELENSQLRQADFESGCFKKLYRSLVSWFRRGCGV
jgi:hypothetical protein